MKDVAVILVGLNACAYIKQCITSLGQATWRQCTYEVIYVDNGSTDASVSMVQDCFPEVRILANPTNLGFCRAANQGAQLAHSRYYFFLNDDTIVQDDAIALLVECMDQTPEAGTVGSRLLNPDGTDQWSGRRFPSLANALLFGRRSFLSRLFPHARSLVRYLYKDQIQGTDPFVVDWVSAAAQLVRAETFQQIGGYAEDYYYWHEAIFCDRIRKAARTVLLHPRSKIVHFEGQGSGKRPYKVRQWHVRNFHKGAYHCYCEHYNLSLLSPWRWLAATFLSTRALALLAANYCANLGKER